MQFIVFTVSPFECGAEVKIGSMSGAAAAAQT
jgi:hypothetical protein